MRFATLPAMIIFGLSVVTAPVYTQGRGNSQAKKTATTTTPKVKSTPQTVKTTAKVETRAPKADVRATKTTTKAATKSAKATSKVAKTTAKAETRVVKAETKAARKTGTTTTVTSPDTTVVTPTTPTTVSVKNPKLEARLLAMLPGYTTVQDASQGFKNWGQFVAAVHVSNNMNIPFADLKAKMTGITPGAATGPLPTPLPTTTTTMSLGQAVQSLKGATTETSALTSTQIRTEVKKAEDAATVELQRTRDRS